MSELELNSRGVKDLFQVLAKLKTPEEARKFMRDLCTLAELKAMAERWQVVRMLSEGMNYRAISKKTGASTATVTRISHWLKHGRGGYPLMLRRV